MLLPFTLGVGAALLIHREEGEPGAVSDSKPRADHLGSPEPPAISKLELLRPGALLEALPRHGDFDEEFGQTVALASLAETDPEAAYRSIQQSSPDSWMTGRGQRVALVMKVAAAFNRPGGLRTVLAFADDDETLLEQGREILLEPWMTEDSPGLTKAYEEWRSGHPPVRPLPPSRPDGVASAPGQAEPRRTPYQELIQSLESLLSRQEGRGVEAVQPGKEGSPENRTIVDAINSFHTHGPDYEELRTRLEKVPPASQHPGLRQLGHLHGDWLDTPSHLPSSDQLNALPHQVQLGLAERLAGMKNIDATTAAWALRIELAEARVLAIAELCRTWVQEDRAAAESWLGKLPASDNRDHAWAALAAVIAETNPEEALTISAAHIALPELKERATRLALRHLLDADPVKARSAIEENPTLSGRARQLLLQRLERP